MQKPRRLSLFIIVLTTLLSGCALYLSSGLELDYDFERFFPQGDPELARLEAFRQDFESDNDLLIISIENRKGVFQTDFLTDVQALTDTLKSFKLTERVTSILDMKFPVQTALGLNSFSLVHPNDQKKLIQDSIRCHKTPGVIGSFIARDGPKIAIYLKTEPYLSKVKSDTLLNWANHVITGYNFDDVSLHGKVKSQQYILQKMGHELLLFISLSAVLLMVFLWITFRAIWGVVIPILVVALSVIWLLGTVALTGEKIDLMASLLPSILFVVGTSDVIHILNKYLQELRKGQLKIAAIKTAFKEVSVATLMTSLTTSIGFLTLMSASIAPIQNFGFNAALGVMLAYVLAFTLLPSLLILLPAPKIASTVANELKWRQRLIQPLLYCLRHPKSIIIGTIAISGIAAIGISNLEVNNYLLEDLSEGDPHMQEFRSFEQSFTGARPIDFIVTAFPEPGEDVLAFSTMSQIHQVENWIDSLFHPGYMISPLIAAKSINQAQNRGRPEAFIFPDEALYTRNEGTIRKMMHSVQLKKHLVLEQNKARISGQIQDYGGKIIKQKLAVLQQLIEGHPAINITVEATGTALLIDRNNEYLVANMLMGLGIAFGVIWLLMIVLFRSLRLATLTLIPNILPLICIAGMMGLTGIDMKVSTSLVFTIAFGIAVDDTLHFIARYRMELARGRSNLRAIVNTYLSTGKAIIMTSFILFAGFLLLILSSFNSTFYIGLLVSVGMLAAVIFDLTILPLILMGKKKPSTA